MKKKLSVYNIIIAIILILILVIGSVVIFVSPAKEKSHIPMITSNGNSTASLKPVFRKDGELRFLNGKTNEIITTIDIEVADDEAEKAQGMMYRDSMAENQGMLFLMGIEEPQAFWMKNTILSLDLLFVNSDRRIVAIQKNTKPYSLDQIPSVLPALYVVEVIAGYTEKYGIKEGDLISF